MNATRAPRPYKKCVPFILSFTLLLILTACSPNQATTVPPTATPGMVASDTVTPAAVISGAPAPANVSINFDNLPDGVPPDWTVLYAPFKAESQPPEVVKAQAQENHFVIDNLGTFSGLYALYNGAISSPNLQISLDAVPDQGSAMSVFLVCRYSAAGWYQFRVSNGSSQIQHIQPQGKIFNTTTLAEGSGVGLDDGTHRLSAVCNDSRLSLLVDGKEIISTQANLLSGGALGFGVEAFDKPGRKAFDNLEVQFFAPPGPTPSPITTTTPIPLPVSTTTPTSTAAPTLTPTAVSTLRPTPIPESELVLYQTEFDDKDETLVNWKASAYSFAEQGFVSAGYEAYAGNGVYRIRTSNPNKGTNLRIFSIYDVEIGSSDVDISIRAKAPYYEGSAGLVCRYSEAGWYQFMVEPNGIWSIRLVKYDEARQLHFHTISSGRQWLGQKVDLRAECKGDRLTIYVDGTKYASLHDSTFPTGKVGVLGWSFDVPGEIGMIDYFTVRRAQWNETGLPGPAPTPGADGPIYTTNFARMEDLNPYWIRYDAGILGLPGTAHLYGGPGSTKSPHTIRYLNDFDPGTDIEIRADILDAVVGRGLICRYNEDGWYQTHYESGYVVLARMERDEQGQSTHTILGSQATSTGKKINLSLKCTGNQISVAVNGIQAIYAEDNTWQSGRYGLMYLNSLPANLKNAFSSYTVRPAQTIKPGELIYDEVFDSPEKIASNWNLDISGADPRMKVQENSLVLIPGDNAVHPWNGKISENSELTLDLEFLAESTVLLHCRLDSPARNTFEVHRNGDWSIAVNDQPIANGRSANIRPDKNKFTIRCMGSQLTLLANGETLTSVEHPGYIPAVGKIGFDVIEGSSQVKLNSLALKIMQGSYRSPAPPLINQISIHTYQPGETIYTWNIEDFLGVIGRPDKAWMIWYRAERPQEKDKQIIVSARKDLTYWSYIKHDLYDLPVEISAETAFTGKSGGVGFFCRYTEVGRYEFLIQPDGKWSIRRNRSSWYEPRAENITVLAHGTSDAILRDANQISVTCRGNELIFNANGAELGRAKDDLYPEGQAGIFFDSFTSGSVTNLTLLRAK